MAQVPRLAESAHDWHVPVQAVAQQTPWAQKPELHSAPVAQVAPRIFFEHVPPLQTLGETQLLSVAQALKQVLPLHVYGAQGSESGGVHWPVALHVDAGV